VGGNQQYNNHHQWDWQRRAAAGNKSVWGQHGNKGVDNCTTTGNDESGWQTMIQQSTNDWSSKGGRRLVTRPPKDSGESDRQRERRLLHNRMR
jgi:hypothetical protein